VSGLTAAIKAGEALKGENKKIILLEASPTLGGRVQSDKTDNGFLLDRGFAVFIDNYPLSKELLDYNELKLGNFLPGALVKLKDQSELAKVADPLRQPEELFNALLAPVGSFTDKLKVLKLLYSCVSQTVEELFQEEETSTLEALQKRWGFSSDMIDKFYKPFLEGIYLAPLEQQSSRMFHFVFKMFSVGAATLPQGGMGAVSEQLASKAKAAGVEIRTDNPVASCHVQKKGKSGFLVDLAHTNDQIKTDIVIIATDGHVAQKLMSRVDGFESLETAPEQPQRKVGCLYYSFDGPAPVKEPILVLSGLEEDRGTRDNPVNNCCFPSQVNSGYAPEGKGLCSVTVLETAMETYKDREADLDAAVRKQLGTWFPDYKSDILDKWNLEKMYYIPNAQPAQLNGPAPANVNGGRDCQTYRNKTLPKGLFICGDHMATATLNGALESGVNAGTTAAELVNYCKE
jgi:phytoene dehydrogenase-like protein